MCKGIVRCLRPGGRFVTVNCNPACDFPSAPSYRKYGFETSVVGEFREGAPITWTFYLEDGAFDIENYFLSVQTHEEALRGHCHINGEQGAKITSDCNAQAQAALRTHVSCRQLLNASARAC
jgi:hypothetical protein